MCAPWAVRLREVICVMGGDLAERGGCLSIIVSARIVCRRLSIVFGFALACAAAPAHATAHARDDGRARARLLADAQSQRDGGHRMEALALCEDILQRWPSDPEASRLRVRLLSELGAAAQALQLARQLASPLAPDEMARLEADLASHQIRWAQADSPDPRQPYLSTDRAVATQDELLARYGDTRPELAARVGTDRLIAYNQASRSAAVVSGYQALRRAGKPLPPYALTAVADALLQQRQPEQAIPLYLEGIRNDPGPYRVGQSDPRIGLLYAYLETGRYREAIALIDKAAAAEPIWLPVRGSTQPHVNPHKTETDLNAALARENAGLQREAWQRIEALRAQAPMNTTLWRELANAEQARGWPRRSEDTLVGAAAIDPSDLSMQLGAINAWRDLNDFQLVEPTLRQVEAVLPRDEHVLQTRDAWDRQRGWQFDLEHDRGEGGAPNFGDYDHETQATLQSPLLDDRWRIYGITRLAGASLQEGHTQRERLGLGLRGYARGWEAYVQALPGIGGDTRRNALEAGVRWFPSDYWTFTADWSNTGDRDVSLRASHYGITAHTLNTSMQWRASELTSVKLSDSRDGFSDGNHRDSWQAQLTQRLHTAPYLTLDGGLSLGTTRNTRTDAPYYSPSCARWGMFTGRLESLLYQHYERSWRQSIDIAAGSYDECRYGSAWTASARYGQTFEPHGGLALGWGLGWASQPYDGKRDSRVTLDLTLHWGE
ncbi:MAG TPA: poly-beta-1,6 N-acetyl-D-glucosamine export porin PgaA [Rhodanobacter sp.]|nr:poly-beta-1,6 N-acetyl-D-glucosamine export porin PgaA [Rhodanobacter sp.]